MIYWQLLEDSDDELGGEEPQVVVTVSGHDPSGADQTNKRKFDTLDELADKRTKLQEELRIVEENYKIQEKIEEEIRKIKSYEELLSKSKNDIKNLEALLK